MYYDTNTHFLAEQMKFHALHRQQNQSIQEFSSELQTLAVDCRFGKSLEERIRDQLVCGIENSEYPNKIFKTFLDRDQDKYTLQKVTETLLSLEKAQKQSTDMREAFKSSAASSLYSSNLHPVNTVHEVHNKNPEDRHQLSESQAAY